MPEVGKRYETIGGECVLKEIRISSDGYRFIWQRDNGSFHTLHSGDAFPESVEEIPESKEEAFNCRQCDAPLNQGIWMERNGYCGTICEFNHNNKVNSVAIDKGGVNGKIDEAYKLGMEIIHRESELNCKKALLRILERDLQKQEVREKLGAGLGDEKGMNCHEAASDKVKEAMEELRNHLHLFGHIENYYGTDRLERLLEKSKNLVYALDEENDKEEIYKCDFKDCKGHVPNAETIEAMQDSREGKDLTKYEMKKYTAAEIVSKEPVQRLTLVPQEQLSLLVFKANGDIFFKERQIGTDKEILEALREVLGLTNGKLT